MKKRVNPKSLENLKLFKKGKSGNPNGAPRKLPKLDELLASVLGEEKEGMTAAEAILKALRAKAAKGDIRAAELILNRAYGKPKEKIDVDLLDKRVKTELYLHLPIRNPKAE